MYVPGVNSELADGLSRCSDPINLGQVSLDHIVRDKTPPGTEQEKVELLEEAHSIGNFGEQEVFKKIWKKGC